jgi:Flp pilus assembly protein TadG
MRERRSHLSSDGQYRRPRRVKSLMGLKKGERRRARGCARGSRRCEGSVAAEFALLAPTVILIAAGIADFGMLATKSATLAGTTRIGAEYARLHPTDTAGIQNLMQSSMTFTPALTFPESFPQSCECDDKTSIACSESCATFGRPGPNRVFIKITASQAFTPLVPWPGIPGTLTAITELRLQ